MYRARLLFWDRLADYWTCDWIHSNGCLVGHRLEFVAPVAVGHWIGRAKGESVWAEEACSMLMVRNKAHHSEGNMTLYVGDV